MKRKRKPPKTVTEGLRRLGYPYRLEAQMGGGGQMFANVVVERWVTIKPETQQMHLEVLYRGNHALAVIRKACRGEGA